MPITRRDILKLTGSAMAASAVPSLAAAEEAVAPLAGDQRSIADSDQRKHARDQVQDVWGNRTPTTNNGRNELTHGWSNDPTAGCSRRAYCVRAAAGWTLA
jgi:hypothetical protein